MNIKSHKSRAYYNQNYLYLIIFYTNVIDYLFLIIIKAKWDCSKALYMHNGGVGREVLSFR